MRQYAPSSAAVINQSLCFAGGNKEESSWNLCYFGIDERRKRRKQMWTHGGPGKWPS